eukprot:GHVN01077001.1.p1 GENE.GHVN01077001.1~~GHVN01077001.1.p1  ORF type:complete len:442 (-),score=81.37 GHVN01077001.1:488-1813(-)
MTSPTISRFLFYGSYASLPMIMGLCAIYPLPVFIQMSIHTFAMIYIGSHLSLKQNEIDPVSGEKKSTHETLTHQDALLFPVIASVALLSLYIAYKFLSPYWVNLLVTVYMSVLGVGVISETITPMMDHVFSPGTSVIYALKFQPAQVPSIHFEIDITVNRLTSLLAGLFVGVGWMVTKNWMLHNILAIAFSVQAISLISVGSFKIAALLLSLLFFYDIFWVFGTEVMVTVAKSFDGPIKIILPRSLEPWQFSILGLGDIVVPGIVVAMSLRFDNFLHQQFLATNQKKNEGVSTSQESAGVEVAKDVRRRAQPPKVTPSGTNETSEVTGLQETASSAIDIHEKFQKLYFWCSMLGYQMGLALTVVVMLYSGAAQPALLYLVPTAILSVVIPASVTGQVSDVLNYSEASPETSPDVDSADSTSPDQDNKPSGAREGDEQPLLK